MGLTATHIFLFIFKLEFSCFFFYFIVVQDFSNTKSLDRNKKN